MSELEEGKIAKWLTAPSRKRALANKMRNHSLNILKKSTGYKKAGDISGEDVDSKDPTGHGRSIFKRGYKETGERSYTKSNKNTNRNYPDSDKYNRPVINNGPKSTDMRKKLTKKYSAQGDKTWNHYRKWWQKADKLDPLEESVKTKITRVVRAIKKATGIQRNSLNKKAYNQWWSQKRPYEHKNSPVTRVKATQNPNTVHDNLYREKHGIRHSWTPGYAKSKYLGMKESLEENLKPSQKAIKYLVNKEVKKNSSASGDDFQPTSRSARLLKKLHEGGIKDLVTKDQEEKRLLKTDKPQKVLSDKKRAKLKALKKIDEAKKKLYIRPSAKPDPRTKRNQKAFERAFGKNTKSFLDTLRDPPETDDKEQK